MLHSQACDHCCKQQFSRAPAGTLHSASHGVVAVALNATATFKQHQQCCIALLRHHLFHQSTEELTPRTCRSLAISRSSASAILQCWCRPGMRRHWLQLLALAVISAVAAGSARADEHSHKVGSCAHSKHGCQCCLHAALTLHSQVQQVCGTCKCLCVVGAKLLTTASTFVRTH